MKCRWIDSKIISRICIDPYWSSALGLLSNYPGLVLCWSWSKWSDKQLKLRQIVHFILDSLSLRSHYQASARLRGQTHDIKNFNHNKGHIDTNKTKTILKSHNIWGTSGIVSFSTHLVCWRVSNYDIVRIYLVSFCPDYVYNYRVSAPLR